MCKGQKEDISLHCYASSGELCVKQYLDVPKQQPKREPIVQPAWGAGGEGRVLGWASTRATWHTCIQTAPRV